MNLAQLQNIPSNKFLKLAKAAKNVLETVVEREGIFDSHNTGYYTPAHPAINVKIYGNLRKLLTDKEEEFIDANNHRMGNAIWENLVEDWWDWANDFAAHLKVGKIESAGRGGGWLVWKDYSLENLRDTYQELCDLLATIETADKAMEGETDPEEIQYHQEEKDGAEYDLVYLINGTVRDVQRWMKYAKRIKKSLEDAPERFKEEVEYRIKEEEEERA